MAATGLFLCTFLIGHLAGNLQLFMTGEEGQLQFNSYAKFMTSNILIKLLSYLTYLSIVFHAIDGIMLLVQNRRARPIGYVKNAVGGSSVWASRQMGVLGVITLVFIVVHMQNFWYRMHWGALGLDANGNVDLFTVVIKFFTDESMGLVFVLLYVLAMAALAFHLSHGISSAFQSLGLNHERYTPMIKKAGMAFAILIPLAFASIPIYIYLVNT